MKEQDGPWWMCEVHALKMIRTCTECFLTHTHDKEAGIGQSVQDRVKL